MNLKISDKSSLQEVNPNPVSVFNEPEAEKESSLSCMKRIRFYIFKIGLNWSSKVFHLVMLAPLFVFDSKRLWKLDLE